MGNAGGHNPAGGDGCWMAAKALVLSWKTQGRSNTLTSGLGLIWHHKCPFLAHSYVFNPQHLWITTTMGEKIWISMWDFARQLALVLHTSHLHGDVTTWCTIRLWEKRVVFEVQTCRWGSGDWGSLYHGHDGWPGTGYWGIGFWCFVQAPTPAQSRCYLLMNSTGSFSHWCTWRVRCHARRQQGETPIPLGLQCLL